MKKILTLSTLLLATVVFTGCAAKPTTEETAPTAQETTASGINYSLDDVAMHKTQSDCWTSIDGYVYDITSAFGKHKGGDEKLLGLCGVEGTKKFEKQHGTNENAIGWLEVLKIGTLK